MATNNVPGRLVPFKQFIAQAEHAQHSAQEFVERFVAEGGVQVAPGIWEKRDENGRVVETLAF